MTDSNAGRHAAPSEEPTSVNLGGESGVAMGSEAGRTGGPTSTLPAAVAAGSETGEAAGPKGSRRRGAEGTESTTAASSVVSPNKRRVPMQSTLVVRRIDPWSAFLTSLAIMFALYLIFMVAVGVTYLLLAGMGVWDRLGGLLSGVAGDSSASVVDAKTVFLFAGGLGLLNVLLFSVMTALGVFVYNLGAGLTGGGVQVTLADRRR